MSVRGKCVWWGGSGGLGKKKKKQKGEGEGVERERNTGMRLNTCLHQCFSNLMK